MTRSYYRAFYALKEDTRGYSAGRQPQGRCVIEARGGDGKVAIYVQDLKPQVPYCVYIIKTGENPAAHCLGVIETTPRFRGEARFDCDANDPGGLGHPIEAYDAAAVVVKGSVTDAPLTGGKDNYISPNWRNAISAKQETLRMETTRTENSRTETPRTETLRTDTPKSETGSAKITADARPTFDTGVLIAPAQKAATEPVKETVIKPEQEAADPMGEFANQASRQTPAEGYDEILDESAAEQTDENTCAPDDSHLAFRAVIHRFNQELDELAEISAQADPPPVRDAGQLPCPDSIEAVFDRCGNDTFFGGEIGWARISMRELALLPINYTDYEQNAVFAAAFYKHGHFIIRRTKEGSPRKYVLGVPESYDHENKHGFTRLGFHTFKCERGEAAAGSMGYWLKEI